MKENRCELCNGVIEESEFIQNLRYMLEIPIVETEPIEQMVIDGTCCLDCYQRQSYPQNKALKYVTGMRYCTRCGDPLYSSIAGMATVVHQRFENGLISPEEESQMMEKLIKALGIFRERRSMEYPITKFDEYFRDEILCGECTARLNTGYSIDSVDIQREVAHV
jgi:hypothetical protein